MLDEEEHLIKFPFNLDSLQHWRGLMINVGVEYFKMDVIAVNETNLLVTF